MLSYLEPRLTGTKAMKIEDYFDFLAENDIRIKGTRIGIETVLYEYIHRCQTPEEIVETYTGLTNEQVMPLSCTTGTSAKQSVNTSRTG